jgi:HEAT repeat protein
MMRMAATIGLVLALAGTAGWVAAQDPETQQNKGVAERERAEREREQASERMREQAERAREHADKEAERAERERERAERMDEVYENAIDQVDEGHYDNALRMLDQVVRENPRRADAALYWRAYSLHKLGRKADALTTLNQLGSSYPKSKWVKDAKALEMEIRQGGGTAPSPESLEDEDLKLMALDGLMNSDPQKAMPMLKKFLQTQQSPKLRDRALFVLAQSGSPEAREILASVARGESYPGLQRKAIQHLAVFGGAESGQALADVYKSSTDPSVKKAVLQAFMISGDKTRVLAAAKGEPDPSLRRAAIQQLGAMGAQDELWQMYGTETSTETKKAIQQALFVGGSTGRLIELVKTEKDPELRLSAVRNLGLIGSEEAQAALESIYKSGADVRTREAVLEAFFVSGNAKRLIEVARTEKDPTLKRKAVQRLSVMGSPEAQQFLMELLEK